MASDAPAALEAHDAVAYASAADAAAGAQSPHVRPRAPQQQPIDEGGADALLCDEGAEEAQTQPPLEAEAPPAQTDNDWGVLL
jgi:hypothetical protein